MTSDDHAWSPHHRPFGGERRRGAVAGATWQAVSGVRGGLLLYELAETGASTDALERRALGLVLRGRLTREVLDWHGHPSPEVLERVHVVEASAVDFLDEAGRALVVQVYLSCRRHQRRAHLPAPSRPVVETLTRLGLLQHFDSSPHPGQRPVR